MGRYEKITAEVTDEMAARIRDAVDSGVYASADEVVRDAMMGWMLSDRAPPLSEASLMRLLEAGRDSGPGIPAEEVFDKLIAKYQAMAEAAERRT